MMNRLFKLVKMLDRSVMHLHINYRIDGNTSEVIISKGKDPARMRSSIKFFQTPSEGNSECVRLIEKYLKSGFVYWSPGNTLVSSQLLELCSEKEDTFSNPVIILAKLFKNIHYCCFDNDKDLSKVIIAGYDIKSGAIKICLAEPFVPLVIPLTETTPAADRLDTLDILCNKDFSKSYLMNGTAFYRLDIVSRELEQIGAGNNSSLIEPGLSADSSKEHILYFDQNCIVVEKQSSEEFRYPLTEFQNPLNQFKLSPDGKYVLFNEASGTKSILNIIVIKTGELSKIEFDKAIYFKPSIQPGMIWFCESYENKYPISTPVQFDLTLKREIQIIHGDYAFRKGIRKIYYDFCFDRTETILVKAQKSAGLSGMNLLNRADILFQGIYNYQVFFKTAISFDTSKVLTVTHSGQLVIYKLFPDTHRG